MRRANVFVGKRAAAVLAFFRKNAAHARRFGLFRGREREAFFVQPRFDRLATRVLKKRGMLAFPDRQKANRVVVFEPTAKDEVVFLRPHDVRERQKILPFDAISMPCTVILERLRDRHFWSILNMAV